MREGRENCLRYLKRGWDRKEGKRHKDFKNGAGGGPAGSRSGCRKKKGGWNPLTNYVYLTAAFNILGFLLESNLESP